MPSNIESDMEASSQEREKHDNWSKAMKLTILLFNAALLCLGSTSGPLLLRLYFLHGGRRKWLTSWLQTGGWPLVFVPLYISYIKRQQKEGKNARIFLMTPFIFMGSAAVGILTGLNDYMFAYGFSYLPVSTSSILISSQLVFNAVFALVIVRHKFSASTLNAIVLLTVGAVLLGIRSGGDHPQNENNFQYNLGFYMTIGGAAIFGLVLPLIELVYIKAKQTITYALVMELQMVLSFFATVFCTIGMLVNNDFKVIPREAKEYELGEAAYYMVLAAIAVAWQISFLGLVGVISASSSLHSGVLVTVLLPITEILAVFFFTEKFNAEKAIALVLSLWVSLHTSMESGRNTKKRSV